MADNGASKTELAAALVVTSEVMGGELSRAAAVSMARELAEYPAQAVERALSRARREVTGRLTLAAILSRLEDGHPGPEAAWAMCPKSEGDSAVWTDEVASAFDACRHLLADGETTAARMAFREVYAAAVSEARADRKFPKWWVSLGHDREGRIAAVMSAVEAGRITTGSARVLLPPEAHGYATAERRLIAIEGEKPRALPTGDEPTADEIQALTARIGRALG